MDHTEPSSPAALGRRLRELRVQRGLKQQDLASDEISTSYVSLIEAGKRAPSETVLATLAQKLGCSAAYLRTGLDEHETEEAGLRLAFAEMALRNGADGEALWTFSDLLTGKLPLDAAMKRRARVGQASALEKLGRLEAAIPLLEDVYADRAVAAGSDEWCRTAVALIRCYRTMGDITIGIEIGERAMSKLDSLGLDVTVDHIQLGSTLMGCYRMRGDRTRAHLMAQRLIAVAEKQGARAARGAVYWNAAMIASSRGQRAEALALTERALAMMAEDDNVRHVATLKMNYGLLLLEAEAPRLDRAKDLLLDAQESLAAAGTADEMARCELCLAQADIALGDWTQAAARAERALEVLGSEPRVLTACARTILAKVHFLREESALGEQVLEAAAHELRLFDPTYEVAEHWRLIGDLWRNEGHTERALVAYDAALSASGLQPTPAPRTAPGERTRRPADVPAPATGESARHRR
ncbi:helix-turn-helix domain-containing protein [Streptomyces sp. NBC_00083]|uniref:helix-turn-helix domain-containing protein n=1 Tax=Streptomyces sp. NBC_00083 TaxID=2975647 RepID=UPI0022510053|nr:helix-turn-helix domain-containing protein [Streptomyces sp. NBC_00083]MCX5386664.1 helix-turn-helix domain-containing protein [Streptomyces sp. NBC_00083]